VDKLCNICKKPLRRSGLYSDCGGDCLLCMARADDPQHIGDVIKLVELYHRQLEIVKTNLYRGLSHSLQRVQARSIEEVLEENPK
jgi:hypothetical protein